MVKIVFVAGARPNFPKIAPLMRACSKVKDFEIKLVHTGQHYDDAMSESFFRDLEIPSPDINLGIGGGTHAENTGRIIIEFEKYILSEKPDLIVVVGDVDSTLACGIVAKKCNIKLAHVESGLRSFDDSMPEEINRVLVDRISDFLFVSEPSGVENLKKEGIQESKIFFIGNVMIDSLVFALPKIKLSKIRNNLDKDYAVLTIHRPALVDFQDKLKDFLDYLEEISAEIKVVWPIHPRTKANLKKFSLFDNVEKNSNIIITPPLNYIDFMDLVMNSKFVLTDSGGIQEETSYLGVPCITHRENTERPITISSGTNILVGFDYVLSKQRIKEILLRDSVFSVKISYWDGNSAERFCNIIKNFFK